MTPTRPIDRPRLRSSALALVASTFGAASCDTAPTEILVTIDSDASTSTPVSVSVRVSRTQDASNSMPTVWRFRSSDSDLRLPASFAVVPEAGQREGTAWIYLDATFGAPDTRQFVIHRVASARFVPNTTVTLSIFLNAACGAAATGCTTVSASACTVATRCEEQGLTCGDDARCVQPTPQPDASAPTDATADVTRPDSTVDAPGSDAPTDAVDASRMDAPTDTAADAPRMDATSEMPAPVDVAVDRTVATDVLACSGGLVACGSQCANTSEDRSNCGACGRVCAAGQSCVGGACRCVPSCGARVCGDDGCGGSCGVCPTGLTCTAGGACACPAGSTACGSTCCSATQACIAGACRCVPSCGARVCGDDGCGGSCGACATPRACTTAGACACPAGSTACGSTCCSGSQACIAGACRCVPSCTGRACGDDGCGGSCGACSSPLVCDITAGACACPTGTNRCSGSCCRSGEACVAGRCCPASWRREFPGVLIEGTARNTDGTWLLAGREGAPDLWVDGNRGYASTLDACGATVAVNTFIPPGVTRANPVSVATRGAARTWSTPPVIVGFAANGTGDSDGFFSALSPTSLTPSNSVVLRVSTSDDLFWQAAQTSDGNLWLVGGNGAMSCPTLALASPTATSSCTWNLFADCAGGGSGTGVTIGHDGFVWASGTRGPNGFVVRYPPSGCTPTPGCRCNAAAPATEFSIPGATSTTGRAMAAGATSTFVVGYAFFVGADAQAFVASVTSDGRVTFSSLWNPTSLGDGFLAAAYANTSSGPMLYASGVRGWTGTGNTANATGVLAAYDATTLGLRWAITVPGAGSCWSVNVDDAGGIVVTCTGVTSSTVRRCLPSGACP